MKSWRMRMSSIMRWRSALTAGLKNKADCLIRQHTELRRRPS
jgi:hypothetical protein